ncbi:MAG: hypothetical protein ACFFDF_04595 [Candidatus Odinarchaeota archaeon]
MAEMMCSYFSLKKSVQDITQEIINIFNMYEYPEIPFTISDHRGLLLKEFERLHSVVFSLQGRLDLWYIERKFENWEFKDYDFSQQIFLSLKSVHLRKIPLFPVWNDYGLSEVYYDLKFESYIADLSKVVIALARWFYFLFTRESKIYGETHVHFSLQELFIKKLSS